jgi:VCBS repeat-containing protein
MKRHIFRASMLSLATAVVLGLTACSGGSGESSATAATTSSSGSGSKGPFKEGSLVVAYKLNADGTRDVNQTTVTTDGRGKFSFASLPWSGPTEFVISGEYLNENTGTYMTLPQAQGLSAVSNITAGSAASVNINVLTNIAAKSIIAKMAEGADISTAKSEAETSVKELFNLELDAGVSLDDLDPTDATANTQANTQLLLVSSAILNTTNPEEVMGNLAEDMADGEVDSAGLAALDEVKEKVTNVDLQQVAVRLEEANIGVTNAPSSQDVLNGTLSFDHNMSFDASLDAYRDTEYTSNEVTVNGIIGESGAISVENGSYSIDNGPFVTVAGTVANGQKVKVKTTSSADFSTSTQTKLTIGGGVIPYTVTTMGDPYVSDTTPNAFDFGFKRNQAPSTAVRSETITITGINEPTSVTISDGNFSIDGGAFTTSGDINNSMTLQVQVETGDLGTQKSVTVTVGDVNGTFNVFTTPLDTTPNVFTFTDVNDVNKTATPTVDSNSVTIRGINTAVPISVVGGKYKIDNGSFTDQDGNITGDQNITLQAIPSDNYETTTTVTLRVGNVIGTFNVTTMSDPFVADTTPNEFSFSTQLNQSVDTDVEANITVSGINTPTPISIENGTYVVNGGTQDANVSNGDVVTVTQHTATTFDTEKVTTLTIGGVSGTFKTRTLQEDRIPNDFSFDSNLSVPLDTEVTSNTITITGITAGTTLPISIENGQYDINDSGYTTEAGTVSLGDVITLKQQTAATQGTSKVTTLTVGSVIRSFTTKTVVNAPSIGGTPTTTVYEDTLYSFTPNLDTNSGEVETWSITNKPSWAIFNTLNGRLEGIPQNGDVGTYTDINITATNAQGSSSIVIASLEVINTNDAPVARDINASTSEELAVDINISSYVSDVDANDSYTIKEVSSPGIGSVDYNGSIITYTPSLNAFGTDSFTYTVEDANGSTATATVTVTVAAVNDAPTAGNDTASTQEDTNLTIPFATLLANDSDVDSNITISAAANAANGTVTISDGNVIYTPNANFNGTDTFTYTVSDGVLEDNATVEVTVLAVNDAAEIGGTTTGSVKEDTTLSFSGVLTISDVDTNESAITVPTDLSGVYGTFAVDANGSWSYTLNNAASNVQALREDENVTDTLAVTSVDATANATITVTVTGTNDIATISGTATANAVEDTAMIVGASLSVDDNDTNENRLVAIVDRNATYGVFNVAADGNWTYALADTPTIQALAEGETLTDIISVASVDATAIKDINVTITGTNDAPVAVPHSAVSTKKGVDFNLTVSATDVDNGAVLRLTDVNASPSTGVTIDFDENGSITFNASSVDDYSLSYTYSDEHNATATGTVAITVTNSDAPVAVADTVTIDEDNNVAINILANDSDDVTADENLTVEIIANALHGQTTIEANNTITYAPNANFNGSDLFTYKITDEDGGFAEANVTITINAVNDAPVAHEGNFSVLKNSNGNIIDVLSNVEDVDNNITELSILSCQDSNGTVDVNSSVITYTPSEDFAGLDSFTCTVSDGDLNTTAYINIDVFTNNAPVVGDVALTMLVGETITGQIQASDDENDTLEFTPVSVSDELNATLTSDGNYTITAIAAGAGVIAVDVSDGVSTTRATFNIAVVYSQEDQDRYDISDGQVLTGTAFDTLASGNLDTIPADTKLYSVWGSNYNSDTNTSTLEGDYLEFRSDGVLIVSDDNETSYTHDNNLSGLTTVSMDDNGNSISVAEVIMLDANMSAADIANEVPMLAALHLPADAVVYKTAVKMLQDEYDIWGPAQDCTAASCVEYDSLSVMVDNNASGLIAYNEVNHNRLLVFGENQTFESNNSSGTVVEVDMTDVYVNGASEPTIINPNAGTWVATTYKDDDDNNVDMILVTVADGVTGYDKYPILVEAGAVIDSNTTNVVYKGDFRPAGTAQYEYRFNEAVYDVIHNYFEPVTIDDWIRDVQDANNTELNSSTFGALVGYPVTGIANYSPFFELFFDKQHNQPTKSELWKSTFEDNGTVKLDVTINGEYDAGQSEVLTYVANGSDTDSADNNITISREIDGAETPIYALKIVDDYNASAIKEAFGLYVTEGATVTLVAGLQLVDEAYYGDSDENATAYDVNKTEVNSTYGSVGDFVLDVAENNYSFAFRNDGTNDYALTLDANGTSGDLVEINLDTNETNSTNIGTWEVVSVVAGDHTEDTLIIKPAIEGYDDTIVFGMNGGSVLLRGDADFAGEGGYSYMANAKMAEFTQLNFENQLLLPYTYEELANRVFYGVKMDGSSHFVVQYGSYNNHKREIQFDTFDLTDSINQNYVIKDGDIVVYDNNGSIIVNIERTERNDLYSDSNVTDGTNTWMSRIFTNQGAAQDYLNSLQP